MLSTFVKQHTCRSAMVWETANGAFYPYNGGRYQCLSNTVCSDFSVLDTNGDDKLDMNDDMYTPYYPGDDSVDWVAQSIFHYGNTSPWGANAVPEGLTFYRKVRDCRLWSPPINYIFHVQVVWVYLFWIFQILHGLRFAGWHWDLIFWALHLPYLPTFIFSCIFISRSPTPSWPGNTWVPMVTNQPFQISTPCFAPMGFITSQWWYPKPLPCTTATMLVVLRKSTSNLGGGNRY